MRTNKGERGTADTRMDSSSPSKDSLFQRGLTGSAHHHDRSGEDLFCLLCSRNLKDCRNCTNDAALNQICIKFLWYSKFLTSGTSEADQMSPKIFIISIIHTNI